MLNMFENNKYNINILPIFFLPLKYILIIFQIIFIIYIFF